MNIRGVGVVEARVAAADDAPVVGHRERRPEGVTSGPPLTDSGEGKGCGTADAMALMGPVIRT